MTTLEALAGATLLVGALVGATKYRPGQDSKLKLVLILTLVVSGGFFLVGRTAIEAALDRAETATVAEK